MKAALIASVGISSLTVAPNVGHAQEAVKSISVLSPLANRTTHSRIVHALVDAGYHIADTTASVVITAPRTMGNVIHLTLRAKLLSVDTSSTRIVVTGDYTIDIMHEEPIRVEESTRGTAGEMWEAMRYASERIKEAVGRGSSN
jgi:hypothetical protein